MENVTVFLGHIESMEFVMFANQINFIILLIKLVKYAHKIALTVQIKLCVDNVHYILGL